MKRSLYVTPLDFGCLESLFSLYGESGVGEVKTGGGAEEEGAAEADVPAADGEAASIGERLRHRRQDEPRRRLGWLPPMLRHRHGLWSTGVSKYTKDDDVILLRWSGIEDPESGLLRFEYGLSSLPTGDGDGLPDLAAFINVGLADQAAVVGIPLEHDHVYYGGACTCHFWQWRCREGVPQ